MPSLPNMEKYETQDRRPPRSRGGSTEAAPQVDIRALKDPNLNADQCKTWPAADSPRWESAADTTLDVAEVLSDATEDQIREYEVSLKKLKRRVSTDLQQNVYQNRTQFIKISKEAEKLKGEMRNLRNLMAELKTNTTALRSASSAVDGSSFGEFPSALSKRDKRSSVADRTVLWSVQMQVCCPAQHAQLSANASVGSLQECGGISEVPAQCAGPSCSARRRDVD